MYFKRGEKREENITLNTQLHVINAIKLYETVFVLWCVYCMFIICLLYDKCSNHIHVDKPQLLQEFYQ